MGDRQRFKDKVVIVTGGGNGIGLGITEAFLEEGATVLVGQRRTPSALANRERLSFKATDMGDPDQVQALLDHAERVLGGCDVVVNNAGVMFEKTVEEMSVADWDAMMAVNLRAPFLTAKHAVPLMRKRGGGAIVNIGSIEGLASNPGHPAYSASKAGLHGLTAAIAVDHGQDGIRCNAVAPGWINSDLSEAYLESMPDGDRVRRELKVMHPVGRLGEPADVARLVLWLASDESGFVTGQVFVVDGGRTKKLPLPQS